MKWAVPSSTYKLKEGLQTLVENLGLTLPVEPLFGLFWRTKYVTFGVADSIFLRD